MKTAVVLRHVPFEDLGTLTNTLHARGYQTRYIDTPRQRLDSVDPLQDDVLVVLGGPIGAYDDQAYPFLNDELHLIRQRLEHQRPVLGICLGAQLMARALGAQVAPMGLKEIGFHPIILAPAGEHSLLLPLVDVPVLHWHGDRFVIPAGAEHLASSQVCDNQAFSIGDHALGLQFHLEVDANSLEGWLVGHACELAQAGIDPVILREQAQRHSPALANAAAQVIGQWLDRVPMA